MSRQIVGRGGKGEGCPRQKRTASKETAIRSWSDEYHMVSKA